MVEGTEYRVQSSGSKVKCSGFIVQGAGFRVDSSRSWVQRSGFLVSGFGLLMYFGVKPGRDSPVRERKAPGIEFRV